METRHLHYNISTLMWTMVALTVAIPVVKTAANHIPLPGFKALINYAWGPS